MLKEQVHGASNKFLFQKDLRIFLPKLLQCGALGMVYEKNNCVLLNCTSDFVEKYILHLSQAHYAQIFVLLLEFLLHFLLLVYVNEWAN